MTSTIGRSLELYYINGRPDGMLTAELFNWTGHVLMTPRTQIAAALARPEAGYAGVYLLLGERDGESRAYIGESEDIGGRIRQHDVGKDWWTSAVLVTAAANKLNKAHARYLEARLIAEARGIGRVPLDNGTNPPRPTLSEADVAKMEAFLDNLLVVLPAVRVDMFIQRARPEPIIVAARTTGMETTKVLGAAPPASPTARFVLEGRRHGTRATALLIDGEFVVEEGSLARRDWEGVATHSYSGLNAELRRAGILVVEGEHSRFAQAYAFRSPSAAAAVVTGRSANGTLEWRQEGSGLTYKEWEAQQLEATSNVR